MESELLSLYAVVTLGLYVPPASLIFALRTCGLRSEMYTSFASSSTATEKGRSSVADSPGPSRAPG